ncbi:hypothetical protein H2200_005348 [Cladophialophora chaetospira]|uniref:Zn(2)-C6 fungal-type domain-containing protein n=1 Tax=Cladophialophora chaetospira TaxID=386627 RepID=A0AA38XCE5_9EURO|nr:hypothetical protein H2200_005348 [Cladophialophora chaetospira]
MATGSTIPSSISPIPQLLSDAGSDDRPAKRQKVAAACDQCREKKIKCDGLKPICRPCQKRFGPNAVCEWGVRKTRSIGASKVEIIRLQSRIDELERRNRRKSLPEGVDQPSPSTPQSGSDQHHSGANAMMGLIEEGDHADESVVGDSSAASFMNRIKAVLDQQVSPSSAPREPSVASSAAAAGLLRQRRFKNPDYVLPSRHQADKLVEVYWRLVDPLYPFIDRNDFMGKYQTLWSGNPTMDDEICFICLLNAMLAVGCILDSSIRPQDRVSSGEVFYKRAQSYVDLEFLQFQNVHTVQCLLLLAQYLQSTREPQQCWLFVGLAIRIAQSLGLDLPSTSAGTGTGKPDDFLRKVWHGCVLMDRTLSMTFGRPTIITQQAAASVPLPLPHSDTEDCACFKTLCTFDPTSPDLHFFLETVTLYEIMSETLVALYSPGGGHVKAVTDSYTPYFGTNGATAAGLVLEMDGKYTTWLQNLPYHLRYSEASNLPQHMTHARQAKVLSLRYSHIRTLLFRPVLSRFCSICHVDDEVERDSLAYRLALQCSVMCVQSALHTADLFGKVHSEVRLELLDDLLPAWWYCILYLYIAATVLVAARLNTTIEAEVGGEEVILSASRTATAALNRYGSFGKHAKRCAAAIELLFDQIPRQRQQQQSHEGGQLNNPGANLPIDVSGNIATSAAGNVQAWTYNQDGGVASSSINTNPITTLPNDATSANYLTSGGQASGPSLMDDTTFFEPTDMRFDLDLGGDMSWLSSIPFELYSEKIMI